ncbi:MAG: ATP-binding protein [Clostridia bacterium]
MKDLSLHLLDIALNSIEACATRIELLILAEGGKLTVGVTDNGRGMEGESLMKAQDPFFTTRKTRKVGLGIPMFSQAALSAGGSLRIHSREGGGTETKADFEIGHVDRKPLGNVGEAVITLVLAGRETEITLRLDNGNQQWLFTTEEVRQYTGDIPLTEAGILDWMEEYINEGINTILGGVLDEVHR